jgi:hypothetical protein
MVIGAPKGKDVFGVSQVPLSDAGTIQPGGALRGWEVEE